MRQWYKAGQGGARLLAALLTACLLSPVGVSAMDDSQCPPGRSNRTADQVLSDHVSAILTANAALVACDYSEEAVVILPGQVARGPDQIEMLFANFFALMGGNISVQLTSATSAAAYTQILYTINSAHVIVTDGVDTFVIRHGRIAAQTARLGGLSFR